MRFWWQQSSEYWELPFYAEFGWSAHDVFEGEGGHGDMLACREQLWAIREDEDGRKAGFVDEETSAVGGE